MPPTVWLVRVGDGSAALSGAATRVFLDRVTLAGSAAGASVALPTAASGAQQALTLSGSATSEGNLTRTADGHHVVLAGYAAAPGTLAVATTSAALAPRVVARVDATLGVDTSTTLGAAFSGGNVRGAASVDGTAFWASGNGEVAAAGHLGVVFATFGASVSSGVLGVPENARFVDVQRGQLHGSSGVSGYTSVFAIGTGTPSGAGQTATPLPGLPTTGASPYAFALVDRDGDFASDTLYLADDRSLASGGGVQKWVWSGAAWTLATTFTAGLTSGARGLAAVVVGSTTLVVVTTAESAPNRAILYVDAGAGAPTASTVATAGAGTVFRGVAFAPR